MTVAYFFFSIWLVLESHKSSVEGIATSGSYLAKNSRDSRSGYNAEDASPLEEKWESFREEESPERNEKEEETYVDECSREFEACPGRRPRSPRNCSCHALAWEECSEDTGKICDAQLGLRCINNTCLGRYRLKVVLITRSSIDLVWDDFKPIDYPYEYILLRSSYFATDLRLWQQEAVGIEPETSVTNLLPNHGYFFRVATWEDPHSGKYGTISAAIFVKTKGGCFYGNRWFDVNETLHVKCEEKCQCLTNGSFACKTICPEEKTIPEMKDPDYKCFKELINTSGCCYKIVCVPTHDDNTCVYKNLSNSKEQMFYSPDCKMCFCRQNGQRVCHQLQCPDLPRLSRNPVCPEPQVHAGQCCPVLFCYRPSTVSSNAVTNVTTKIRGAHTISLTFLPPLNRNLLNYKRGYEIQYRKESRESNLEKWMQIMVQPAAVDASLGPKSPRTTEISELEANTTYLFRVRIHLDWKTARRLFIPRTTTADGPSSRMEVTSDLKESIPLTETTMPPESVIPFSLVVSVMTSIQAGCVFQNRTLKLGEVIRESCEQYCECGKIGVTCRPVCPQVTEEPRRNCLTTHLPYDCCLSWICRPDRRPYRAISMSATFELEGTCHSPGRRGLTDVDVISTISRRAEEGSDRVCIGISGGEAAPTECVAVHVQVTCANATGNDNEEHAHYIRASLKWTVARKNFSSFDVIGSELQTFVEDIGRMFVAKDFRILLHGIQYGPARNWNPSSLTPECDEGYKKTQYDCVEFHPIYKWSPARTNPELHVEEISETRTILKWRPYKDRPDAQYKGDTFIAYRSYKESAKWKQSKSLNISTSRYVLSNLRSGQKYEAKFVWKAKIFGIGDSTLASIEFETKMMTVVSSPAVSKSSQVRVVVGVVVSVCILLVIAFVLVILWRRRSRRLRSNFAGYENKSFGIQLSENYKSTTSHLKA